MGGDIKTDYHYQAEALDADGDDLTYSLLAGPVGMTIDSQTGLITWKPDTIGFYEVNIQVIDGNGGKATQSYNIEVIDDNLPPQITNQIPTRIPSGKYFSHQVEAVDPEGQKISYSLASQASGMTMNTNGSISWSNPQPGRYPITVVVTDP
ncbi:Ig domain-containing protein [Snodgrassella alvi]|uniref:Ig domain-containing protein n=1 Tax=Snodgrassella alvi TaxID=1196083 RepID=UPI003461643E